MSKLKMKGRFSGTEIVWEDGKLICPDAAKNRIEKMADICEKKGCGVFIGDYLVGTRNLLQHPLSAYALINTIESVSLVEGELPRIPKAEEDDETKKSDSFSIFKTDEDKRLVFGWASIAITVDGEQLEDRQKDMIDPEDLEEAAYEYVLNFRDTGEEHIPTMRKKGKLVESCVFTAEKQKAMGIPEGTVPVGWWIGFKISDDDAWNRVKSGHYKMFSIEGKANRVPVEKSSPVAKSFDNILKYNDNHDELGRFAPKGGGTTSFDSILFGREAFKEIANNDTVKSIVDGGEYWHYGIRIQEEDSETVGQVMERKSKNFGDAFEGTEYDGEELDGVSSIDIEETHKAPRFGGYDGRIAYLLGSDNASGGNDPGESVMRDPVVLAKLGYKDGKLILSDSVQKTITKGGITMSRYDHIKKVSVAKTFDEIIEVQKFNPYHDAKGRFSSANGATSFTYAPGKSKAHDMAIAREQTRSATAASSTDTSDAARELASGKHNSLEGYLDENGNLIPEREAVHQEIINKLLHDKFPVDGQATMTMLGGGPASGKSSVLNPDTSGDPHSVTIDPDAMKAMLPGYKEMAAKTSDAASYYHEESSALAKRFYEVAASRNLNIIYDGTGDGSESSVQKKIDTARAAGHKVVAKYVTIDTETAVARNQKRYDDAVAEGKTPRLVPADYVRATHAKVTDISVAKASAFDEIEIWDNNGARGQHKLIAKGGGGSGLKAVDKEAFQKFLDKGKGYSIDADGSVKNRS